MSLLYVAVQVVLAATSAVSDIRYARPINSPLSNCPGQPCLTLQQYAEVSNFTTGTTLRFFARKPQHPAIIELNTHFRCDF